MKNGFRAISPGLCAIELRAIPAAYFIIRPPAAAVFLLRFRFFIHASHCF
ncbi:hypothetical protein QB898_08495 [Ottowia sp. 10c7w1]|uniref:Uncharacterized protein n=1 Tax=Ottowia cancrivicina TaxID=3040346 RepID=A0AAW6RMG0_9BURK|nr:hypothetical protein [Ottowia sp. 10c7w1]